MPPFDLPGGEAQAGNTRHGRANPREKWCKTDLHLRKYWRKVDQTM
jgi:hypothetical protein